MGRKVFAAAFLVSLLGHLFVLSVSLATYVRGRALPEEGIVRVSLREAPGEEKQGDMSEERTKGGASREKTGTSREIPPGEAFAVLDEENSPYLDYLLKVKRRIGKCWSFPEGAPAGAGTGVATVRFSLDPRGKLLDYYIRASSGHPALDHEALDAVKIAAPYDPFPPAMRLSRLHIDAEFHYK